MVCETSEGIVLSQQARSLWAKSDTLSGMPEYEKGKRWLPLFVHMYDSGKVAEGLWSTWIPEGTKQIIARPLDGDEGLAERLTVFLATVHDLGKATPVFQSTPCGYGSLEEEFSLRYMPEKAGLPFPSRPFVDRQPKHPVAGQGLLERYLEKHFDFDPGNARSFASIVGCHHGKPPTAHDADAATCLSDSPLAKDYSRPMGLADDSFGSAWADVQEELVRFAQQVSGFNDSDMKVCSKLFLPAQVASVVTGVVIMCDWIASNQDIFPLVPIISSREEDQFAHEDVVDVRALNARAQEGWRKLCLQPSWSGHVTSASSAEAFYQSRFGFPEGVKPYPMQESALRIASETEDPAMLLVIEAYMGDGKTEAALAAAEVLASRTGKSGVCVALPTMATTDAMFGRVHSWLERMLEEEGSDSGSIYLAHGKAQLNEEFQGIVEASFDNMGDMGRDMGQDAAGERVFVSEWMRGRKKGMLSDFVVCTVDQVLMAGLGMKHLSMRHLALANKVVVIDECHAYDAYMCEYLNRALEWLGSWKVPVVLLSATLSESQRDDMVASYLKGKSVASSVLKKEPSKRLGLRERNRLRREKEAEDGKTEASARVAAEVVKPVPSRASRSAYPLITYTEGKQVRYEVMPESGRHMRVELSLMEDDDETLARLLEERLSEGGIVGVVCDTVSRAQEVARTLSESIDDAEVMLTHSRFMDIDRMQNEVELRSKLGPKSSIVDGSRPNKAIVVGTQVLEQSLDIDFDVMVTDLAPVDLLMQRFGRLHRHGRGEEESDRPEKLRKARVYVRGIEKWDQGVPQFNKGITHVYSPASLMEALAVLGLVDEGSKATLELPCDIAQKVRGAYSDEVVEIIPEPWKPVYDKECSRRKDKNNSKVNRADVCRIPSIEYMCKENKTLTEWYMLQVDRSQGMVDRNDERGQQAVRDTQESVEVLLFEDVDGETRLLPWVGDERLGVPWGCRVPTECTPRENVAKVASQCSVGLPSSMCRPDQLDQLIDELEVLCGERVSAWQDSYWLAGKLALFLQRCEDGSFVTETHGFSVTYSREDGLAAIPLEKI